MISNMAGAHRTTTRNSFCVYLHLSMWQLLQAADVLGSAMLGFCNCPQNSSDGTYGYITFSLKASLSTANDSVVGITAIIHHIYTIYTYFSIKKSTGNLTSGKWLNCNWDSEIDKTKMNIDICSSVPFAQLVLVQIFRLVGHLVWKHAKSFMFLLFCSTLVFFCTITAQIIITLLTWAL